MKDYFGYSDQICVITGAASGMGKAATEMLVDLGAKVYALDANDVTTSGIAEFVHVNLSDRAAIDAAFSRLPDRIDKFFGVAGLSGVRTDYHTTVTVNFIANKYITDEYLDKRISAGGAIAFITSTGGTHWHRYRWEYKRLLEAEGWDATAAELRRIAPQDGFGPFAYALSKRCLNAYAANRMVHFAGKGVRVNVVLPASSDTGMRSEFAQLVGSEQTLVEQTGMAGRLAEPREMAEPLIFLNSNMSSFITGCRLMVDYGDETLKLLKLKKDLQNAPVALKIYNTRIARTLLRRYIDRA
ncbi:SDR family oxidoreductase [[Mycobacterium] zoologicum]|uniref:SDR family oxidoreductase n=1 Tax=[Mycobacterium] zoologicum TaxID=2872311 RepID=UPI002B9B9A23|nr:SDR family oxidoreductase [Mycolicibacter sp. MYC101]MEB3065055.1 SDR family oxidoreductase [Mycolicibacter sp. MYC101]